MQLQKTALRTFGTTNPILHSKLITSRHPDLMTQMHIPKYLELSIKTGNSSSFASMVLGHALTLKSPKYDIKTLTHKSQDDIQNDAIKMALGYLNENFSIGAYSESFGMRPIRENICKYLEQRDGVSYKADNLLISDSVHDDLTSFLKILSHDKRNCFLIPAGKLSKINFIAEDIRATIRYFDISPTSNDETLTNISNSVKLMKEEGLKPTLIFIENPKIIPYGEKNKNNALNKLLSLCFEQNLLIVAEEGQLSMNKAKNSEVDKNLDWPSLKKVLKNHPNQNLQNNLEMISSFCLSSLLTLETTKNGGFLEFVNIEEDVMVQIRKFASMMLSANSSSQVSIDSLFAQLSNQRQLHPNTIKLNDQVHEKNKNILQQAFQKEKNMIEKMKGVVLIELSDGSSYLLKFEPESSLPKKTKSFLDLLKKVCKNVPSKKSKRVVFDGEDVGYPGHFKVVFRK